MYPQEVEQALDELEQELQDTNFYVDIPDTDSPTVRKVFGKILFDKWCSTGALNVNQEEAEDAIRRCVMESALQSLIDKGLVNTIENEQGKEVVFLTSKGKECVQYDNGDAVPSIEKF